MRRRDLLLYFIYIPVKKPNMLSPIQIMKGMFLLRKELNLKNFYDFKPYLYGPCSFEIYRDLRELSKEGLIALMPSSSHWKYYIITSLGIKRCRKISLEENLIDKMRDIKRIVMEKSFFELLKYVYNKYPEYAVNSIIDIKELIG